MNDNKSLYELWKTNAVLDAELKAELDGIEGNDEQINDRFYRELEFGTGGLRGVIGAGTNRMNVYTVGRATQGLADYLNGEFEEPAVAVAYDTRNKSELFAREAASVLAANNIKVFMFEEPVPTPMLSYALRELGCASGIIITASHNPAKYNGYKCYDPNGYQMTDEAADKTYGFIKNVDMFTGIKRISFEQGLKQDMIDYIEEWIYEGFYESVLERRVNKSVCAAADLKVIYTPLNGTGNKPVRHILAKSGVKDVTVVAEQELPDGNFPTCPFPNPEIRQSFECALKLSEDIKADLLLATDPDCDRVGIAVLDEGEYKLMTGNEVGAMLTRYILGQLKQSGKLPDDAVVVKSIVTTPLINVICSSYGVQTAEFLTGFKYIGEYITQLEQKGELDRFILGMEESYGYLSGSHARDKDAVVASMLVCEMAAWCKTQGITLYGFMQKIYEEYGFYLNRLDNYGFEGASGMQRMGDIMTGLRQAPPAAVAGDSVVRTVDYKSGEVCNKLDGTCGKTGLPPSNVLSFTLKKGDTVVVRPSGTEPKLKIYITSKAGSREESMSRAAQLSASMKEIIGA